MNLLTNTVLLKENELKKVLKEIQNRKKFGMRKIRFL